jgi:hypothetical protein
MSQRGRPAPQGYRWVFCSKVRHWRSGKLMRRRDGKKFAFLVRSR